MDTHERIRFLRKNYLELSQEKFGQRLGVSRDVIKNIELNLLAKPEQKEPLLKLLCKEFNVRYDWLTTGQGEIFNNNDEATVNQVIEKYGLDNLDQKIIGTYIQLPEYQRSVIKGYVRNLVDAILDDENYEEYRDGYIEENAAPMAARNGNAGGLREAVELFDNLPDED